MKRINVSLVAILGSGCCLLSGSVESSFQLSDESRLPVWIKLPPTVQRQDVSLTLNYYSNPFGPTANFILRNRSGATLEEVRDEATVGLGKRQDLRLLPTLRNMLDAPELKVRVAEAASAMLGLPEDPEEWVAEDYKKALDEKFGRAEQA